MTSPSPRSVPTRFASWLLLMTSPAFFGSLLSTPALAEPPVLRAALESEPLTLDWSAARTSSDRFVVSLLMRGLLKYENGSKPVCDLCKSYRASEDGKTYFFELDPVVEWSDGEKLDAQQFVDSFQRLINPAAGLLTGEEYRIIAGSPHAESKSWDPKKLEVVAEGKNRLRIQLSEASALFPHLLTKVTAFPIRKEFAKDTRKDLGVAMAGGPVLGPYQLAAWEKGRRLVIEGNPKFTGMRPVYRVDFFIGAHPVLLAKFKKGRLDTLPNPTTEDLLGLPRKNIQVSPYWATRILVANVGRKSMADPHLRRSILYSLDRSRLPGVLKNGERSATGVIPPGLPGHRELPLVTVDESRAQSERLRATPSGPLELTLLIHAGAVEKDVAQWISSELAKVQVKLKIQARTDRGFEEAFAAGQFDLAVQVWSFDIASPLDLLRAYRTGSPMNHGHWTHVAYDALLTQLLNQAPQTKDLDAQSLDEITRIIEVQEAAIIPLGYPAQSILLGPRVSSFAMTPYGDPDLIRIELRTAGSKRH